MEFDYNIQTNKKLKVCERNCVRWIEIEEITHMICDGYITNIYLITGERITVSKLLKKFEEMLDKYGFEKPNRSTLVNLRYISRINYSKSSRVIFIKDIEINLSRRRASLFKMLK